MSAAARVVSVPHPSGAGSVYSPAVTAHGEIVYVSGQLGCIDSSGARIAGAGDVAAEAAQALGNLRAVLAKAGSSLAQVCRVVIYLTDIAHYATLNAAYAAALREAKADAAPPARACIAVAALPLGGLVEIECTALVDGIARRVVGFQEGKLFSAAVVGGTASTVWTSGQLALDAGSGSLGLVGGDDAGVQATKALQNMLSVLEAAGSSPAAICRSTVFMTDIEQYGPMNTSYGETLGLAGSSTAAATPPPSRAAFAVKALPLGGLVEVMCVASSGNGSLNRTIPGMSASPVYSPAVTVPAGNDLELIYVSGQVALDPSNPGSKALVGGGDVAAEMKKACENMVAVLEQVGSGREHVLKTNIYCSNMSDYGAINVVYKSFFGEAAGGPPARVCVQVKQLPLGALVEICCFAVPA